MYITFFTFGLRITVLIVLVIIFFIIILLDKRKKENIYQTLFRSLLKSYNQFQS